MVRRFIKELWHNIRSTYDGIGFWLGAIVSILWLVLPTFNLGEKVNTVISTISLTCRLLIIQSCLFVSVILASYRIYKKQNKTSFFKKNASKIIKGLENNIKEIDGFFNGKKRNDSHCQELKDMYIGKIAPNFIPTIIDKSIDDTIGDIMLFLKDYKPNLGRDINTKYEETKEHCLSIVSAFYAKDMSPTAPKAIKLSDIDMLGLQIKMQVLANTLRSAVQIIEEEQE